jgi:hypothetical protein
MAPFIHLRGRSRLTGLAALIATALVAVALGQALSHTREAAAAPRRTAVTLQRATAVAVGQIARPARQDPLWHVSGNGEPHHHKKGG